VIALLVGAVGAGAAQVSPTLVPVLLASIAAALSVLLVTPKTRVVVCRAAVWGWSLQTAVMQATMNGLRGRWDVWR
jgi:hypothetical protein